VLRVSPDAYEDERSGVSFYAVELEITPEAIAALGGLLLVAGMPVTPISPPAAAPRSPTSPSR
jgi:hypothetical protein